MRTTNKIREATKKKDFNWLGREQFISDFSNNLLKHENSKHICLNGIWGSGKTTTISGIINYFDELEDGVKPLILYLDAWKYEHHGEPLFALLKLIEEVDPDLMNIIKDEIQDEKFELQVGLNVPFFSFNIKKDKERESNRILNESEYIDVLNRTMIKAIKKFKEEKSNKLIIFIDELDRARPDFALRTIEMFHHLQDELPTHIVYSVDMNQLNSIIKHYYGYEYNTEIFTHKVFDEVITLKKLNKEEIQRYVKGKLSINQHTAGISQICSLLTNYMAVNQLESLRTVNKICENISKKLELGYFNPQSMTSFWHLGSTSYLGYIELLIALEVYSLNNPMKPYDFFRGNNLEELLAFLLENEERNRRGNIWKLITASYNHNKSDEVKKEFLELREDEKLEGLKRIFIPPSIDYDNKPVFTSEEWF